MPLYEMSAISITDPLDFLEFQIRVRNANAVLSIDKMHRDTLEDTRYDLLLTAVRYGHADAVTALLRKGLRSGYALDEAVRTHKNKIAQQLIDAGVAISPLTIEVARYVSNKKAEDMMLDKIEFDKAISAGLDGTW